MDRDSRAGIGCDEKVGDDEKQNILQKKIHLVVII